MTHHHHIPSAPLDQHIAGFTYYKGYRPVHSIDRYLPNGNIEIIIDLTATPKHIYDNYTLETIQTCRNIWISGQKAGSTGLRSPSTAAITTRRTSSLTLKASPASPPWNT